MELKAILARIDVRLEKTGLNDSKASRLAKKPDAIRNMRRAVENDDRQGVSTATLNALAPVLKTTGVWLFAGAGPEDPDADPQPEQPPADTPRDMGDARPSRTPLIAVTYAGLVEAGAWREVSEFTDVEEDELYYPADPQFPGVRLLAFDVRGDSMNALKPRPILSGDRVVALDFEGLQGRVALHTGMIVVVQQSQQGGLLVERSVKQLEVFEDRYEFHPRSEKTAYKPIVIKHDTDPDDGREVRILAWVRDFVGRL